MTAIEMFFLVSTLVGVFVVLPLLLFAIFRGRGVGYRVVTYGQAVKALIISVFPVVNLVALVACLWVISYDRLADYLDRPMIKETQ